LVTSVQRPPFAGGESTYFLSANRNKESIALDLKDAADRDVALRLVVLSITGFGHDGPEGGRAGYDQIAQGEAGLMSLTGSGPDDPQRVGVPIGDLLAGMYGAYGVVAALHERSATGSQGLLIDVEHSTLGPLRLPGPPLRFFDGEQERTPGDHRPPPALDEHGPAIRAWLDR
jgi:crotonobetainyl-CoA:carnitine CoA-transferase CaiB-like acyl-CoA transferase